MNERQFSVKFIRKIKKDYPGVFIYKIPDTAALGGMRPFDIIMVYKSVPYAIELKKDSKQNVTPYQRVMLDKFQDAGGKIRIVNPESAVNFFNEFNWI